MTPVKALVLLLLVAAAKAGSIGDYDGDGAEDVAPVGVDLGANLEQATSAPLFRPPVTAPRVRGSTKAPTSSAVKDKTGSKNGTLSDKGGLEPLSQLANYDNSANDAGFGGDVEMGGGGEGFTCPSVRYRNKCYQVTLSQENWYTARDYCQRIGQTLVRITSSDEATFLASYLYEGGKINYWTDLYDEKIEGMWTYADGTVGFTDWFAPGEPNGNRNENCGLLGIGQDRVGRLYDEPCGEWRRYVCERRTGSFCRRAGYKRKCYWFSVQPANWFNAREYCATMGQRLARVTGLDELNFLARVMPRPSWIDLRYGGQGVGWTYADGSSSSGLSSFFGGASMSGWGARCAELRRYNPKEGRAVGVDCNTVKSFICESPTLAPGSEMVNPEDEMGSVMGAMGPAMGPGGPANPMGAGMSGGMAGLGPDVMPPPMGGYGYGAGGMGMAGGMGGMGMGMG